MSGNIISYHFYFNFFFAYNLIQIRSFVPGNLVDGLLSKLFYPVNRGGHLKVDGLGCVLH